MNTHDAIVIVEVKTAVINAITAVYPGAAVTVEVNAWDTFRDGTPASYLVTINGDLEANGLVGVSRCGELPSMEVISKAITELEAKQNE